MMALTSNKPLSPLQVDKIQAYMWACCQQKVNFFTILLSTNFCKYADKIWTKKFDSCKQDYHPMYPFIPYFY